MNKFFLSLIALLMTATVWAGTLPVAPAPRVVTPVQFEGFEATRLGQHVQLAWATREETNKDHLEIERSTDGRIWKVVGLALGTNDAGALQQYMFIDQNIKAPKVYYRIHLVGLDGASSYSAIKEVK